MKTRSIMRYRTEIERMTRVSDNGGGWTEDWNSTATNIPCRAWFVDSTLVVTSDRPESIKTRLVIVPKETDIHEGDRLVSVTDRKGTTVLFDGPLMVDDIAERPDYLRLTTRKIT